MPTSQMCCSELQETLKRLNKGAQKVKSITGNSDSFIFRGSIAFCLKDVQRAAMRATVKEFRGKLNNLVQSGDNFVSNIYNNQMSTTAFPPLSRDFYKTLETVRASCSCCFDVRVFSRSPDYTAFEEFRTQRKRK